PFKTNFLKRKKHLMGELGHLKAPKRGFIFYFILFFYIRCGFFGIVSAKLESKRFTRLAQSLIVICP
ncbi:hypothetical protein OFM39_31560, partial [Escherichia coli]|nr:hypothetical protein [Escherichia coli]